jgi:hypothetical protein
LLKVGNRASDRVKDKAWKGWLGVSAMVDNLEVRLRANIGVWGIRTRPFSSIEALMKAASVLFEIPNNGHPEQILREIYKLSRNNRRSLVRKNKDLVLDLSLQSNI